MSTLDFDTAVRQEEAYLRRVHPTPDDVPGCMALLDDFLLCHVISSQVKSLYRFGQMAECGQKLAAFKFCMAGKALHPEARRDAWIRHRAEWWARRRMARSSEDVWAMRTEPIRNFPPAHPDPEAAARHTVD